MKILGVNFGKVTPPRPKQDQTSLRTVRPKAPPKDGFDTSSTDNQGPLFYVGNRFLPEALGPDLKGRPQEMRAFRMILDRDQPISIRDLPPGLVHRLESKLEGPLRGLVRSPHAGLQRGVFDFAKLNRATTTQVEALKSYLDPGFIRRPIGEKAEGIAAIADLLLPGGVKTLERFHLPRPFSPDSAAKPVTFAMEAEAGLATRPETLHYYAPDPSGKLDDRALTDKFLSGMTANTAHAQAWARMTPDQQRKQLRWHRMPLIARRNYLQNYREHVDPKVALHRVTDPKMVPNRQPLPDSLCETLVWEGAPLSTAEIITEDHSKTLDTLLADVEAVAKIGKSQAGYHIHQVVELSTPEDVKRIGPGVTGLAAMEDLRIFTRGVRIGTTLPTHTHLEVWQADAIGEVAASFADGKIKSDAIDIHKFHCVGMREGIYGGENRLGIEIRAVLVGRNQQLAQVAQRTASILAEGHLDKLPPPPWEKWNAGEAGLENKFYNAMKSEPQLAGVMAGADLDFREVLEVSSGPNPTRDAWKFACPFWAFEELPGVTDTEKATIKDARMAFSKVLIEMSQMLSEAIGGGRELDSESNQSQVQIAMSQFFATTKIDEIINRTLNRVSEGRTPDGQA